MWSKSEHDLAREAPAKRVLLLFDWKLWFDSERFRFCVLCCRGLCKDVNAVTLLKVACLWVAMLGLSLRSAIYELSWFSLLTMSVVFGGERLFDRQLKRRSLNRAMMFLLGCSTDYVAL